MEKRIVRLHSKRLLHGFGLLAAVLALTACTVVPIEQVEEQIKSETFDPVTYVDSIWDSQVLPVAAEKSTPLGEALPAIKDDLEGAGEKYAKISVSGAYNFLVKGSGTVASVDTKSSTGTAVIKLDDYSGPVVVKLQIGPRVSGDSVRDSVGFIEFGQFKEQTEFGKVSREINKRIAETVVKSLERDSLAGKQISFEGAFTIRTTNQTNIKVDEVVITPVMIEVK